MHPQEVARYRSPSWGSFRLERAAMLGVGKSRVRYGRETKVKVASVVADGDAQVRGDGKHGGVSLAVCFDSNVP